MKKYTYLIVSACVILFSGCTGSREPKVPQVNSGIDKTTEWNNYNKYAKNSNKPILDFIATDLRKPKSITDKIKNYEEFNIDDKKLYLVTKWHNVNKDDLFEVKYYQPDGRLYHYHYVKYRFSGTKWLIYSTLSIDKFHMSKIEGQWKADIYMKGKKVATKNFTIGKHINVEKTTINKIIGVFPFLDSKMSKYKHSFGLSDYLSKGIQFNNKNILTITPRMILKDLIVPNTDYKTFREYIEEDLNGDDSIIKELATKYNMDYAIVGKVQSTLSDKIETKMIAYIIDCKTFTINNTVDAYDDITRGEAHIGTDWTKLRIRAYNKLLNEVQNIITK